jgi:hypothetical protein
MEPQTSAMSNVTEADEAALVRLTEAIVNQHHAQTIVSPKQNGSGFWFGGGNMIQAANGTLLLVGRYRNAGDSRTGVSLGERGFQLSVLRSDGPGRPFEEVLSLKKADLCIGDRKVLSIEGAALRQTAEGLFELYISSEKTGIDYPTSVKGFLKHGTGVWTIERLEAKTIEELARAPLQTVLESKDPQFLHVKDPFLYERPSGDLMLFYCTHPFCWTSSNSAYALMRDGELVADSQVFDFFRRGTTWDVAMTRATCVFDVPQTGRFRNRKVSLIFYDGGESIRELGEHQTAINRPRGYSCEEIGGVAYIVDGDFSRVHRLSKYQPLMVSPWGTGCSRYVDVLATKDGMITTWQQSQKDFSQPLVMNFVESGKIRPLLA